MLYYNRTDICKGIDPTTSNRNKRFMIFHYWLLNHEFKFQDAICNGCHNLTILCLNTRNIAIITVKNVDYGCIVHNIKKPEAINLLESSLLENRDYI